ncbi:MAG TPA: hypothetical protein VLA05_05190 [Coriobacteriia bacterium]|nr:hypothetical protein [Coriobacteriia bacterium]
MSSSARRRLACAVVALTLAVGLVGCSSAGNTDAGGSGAGSNGPTTGASPGESLARSKCTMCHTYDRVEQADKDRAGWEQTIDRMIGNGLVVTAEERDQITEYLVERDQ